MKLTTCGRARCAVLSWVSVIALLAVAPVAMAAPPVIVAQPDRVLADTDGGDGEFLTVSVSASDPDGDPLTYEWRMASPGSPEGTYGSTPSLYIHTTDGVTTFRIIVRDNHGESAEDTFLVTVLA